MTPSGSRGLTTAQVQQRIARGDVNVSTAPKTKSVGQIVCSHVFTLFNFLNFILAALVLAVGSYRNLLFMGVVLSNIAVGIFQDVRAKRIIDKLSLLTAPQVTVLRDGALTAVAMEELVRDDWMRLEPGNQIAADAVVVEGELEVNEALLTGEADPIPKAPGDSLRSGSFVVAGTGMAQVCHVGEENYVAQITRQAKTLKKHRSILMETIQTIIRIVSFGIVPMAVLMFCKQYFALQLPFDRAVVAMTSSAVGMIPEGMVLLTSVSLALGIIKLASKKTLVQEMYSIESLARVDVLCLDKTGTITEGSMKVEQILPLSDTTAEQSAAVFAAMVQTLEEQNATAKAIRAFCTEIPAWTATDRVPFSSARKYSAVAFAETGSFVMGAPEVLLSADCADCRSKAEVYTTQGKRVLVLCRTTLVEGKPTDNCPIALLVLSDTVRSDAAETFAFFKKQGVALKVISGDTHATVASVAREAGMEVTGSVDLLGMTDEQVVACCESNNVFGRVSPQQKQLLVKTLQQNGHTVAMTGDGVNDVLALKSADCSIAMAAGSDAARTVSQLVLMDSNFASLPHVVAEGRRVINNMRRASSLYLVKTIYSTLLSLLFLFLPFEWPFIPIQITLIGAVTVGIPSFFLAMEPNDERVEQGMLRYILLHAVPGAVTIVLSVLSVLLASLWLPMTASEISTLCACLTGFAGFLVLFSVCRPFTKVHTLLFSAMCAGFLLCVFCFGSLFQFLPLPIGLLPVLVLLCVTAIVWMWLLSAVLRRDSKTK